MGEETRDNIDTFEVMRALINLGGLTIVIGMVVVIVATIISG